MKMRTLALLLLAAAASSFAAMPTKQELKQVEGLVQELMRPEVDAMKSGVKNRADVAKAAIALAEKAKSNAAKLLLLKGSFTLYVGHGAFDEAIGVLRTIKATIPDISPQHVANMVESALRNIPKNRGGQLYRILDDAKARVRHQDELKAALEKSAKRPSLRALHVAIAEHYAYFGDWPKALEEFAKGDNAKAAEVAKAEKGEGKMPQKAIAEFWWDYAAADEAVQRAFRRHAADVYAAAIASGGISGLETVLAQRRIDEAKEYGEDLLASVEKKATPPGGNAPAAVSEHRRSTAPAASANETLPMATSEQPKPLVLDLGGGVKMEMIGCPAGTFMMSNVRGADKHVHKVSITRPFWIGTTLVSAKQYDQINKTNEKTMEAVRDANRIFPDYDVVVQRYGDNPRRFCQSLNKRYGNLLPPGYLFRLPTEAELEYAITAGGRVPLDNAIVDMDCSRTEGLGRKKGVELYHSIRLFPQLKPINAWGIKVGWTETGEVVMDCSDGQLIEQAFAYANVEIDPLRTGGRWLSRRGRTERLLEPNGKGCLYLFRVCVGPDLLRERGIAPPKPGR